MSQQHEVRPTTNNNNSSSGRPDRRASMASGPTESENVQAQQEATPGHKPDSRKPLNAVMSEDYLTSAPFLNRLASSPEGTSAATPTSQKMSFLSKFARSEVRTSKSIDKAHTAAQQQQQHNSRTRSDLFGASTTASSGSKMNNENERESRTDDLDKSLEKIEGGPSSSSSSRAQGTNESDKMGPRQDSGEHKARTEARDPPIPAKSDKGKQDHYHHHHHHHHRGKDETADEDNQVLPAWPSRMEAAAALEPSLVQHQVYSLKDYSQVSGPSEPVAAGTNRLQKSMSQDRKVGSRNKRMSECTLTGASSMDAKTAGRQRRLPSMIGKISTPPPPPVMSGTSLVPGPGMGPASSVNSLLLPATAAAAAAAASGKPTGGLVGESRIDRMRKLFVSPLSLRGGTGLTSAKSSSAAQAASSTHSRLSLQAGANMLNKPHHLMHMYRSRVAVGGSSGHHSRRSPMRQKQGNTTMKGFRVYGCPLSMANTMYPITCFGRPDIYKQQAVPYILARLCNYIEENSSQLTHEGIFRVSGNARLMEKLKTLFDHLGDAPLESESVDVATSASMLKMYLRELPEPLIPTRMNYYFFTLAKKYQSLLFKSGVNGFRLSDNPPSGTGIANEPSSISDGQSTLDRHRIAFMRDLTKLIRKLPIENYNLLKYLACFLHRISLKQQSNKMSAEALGIVFGPNVFRIRSESYKGLKEQELSNQIMASIISNYKQLFDCELTDPLGNLVKSDEFLNLSSHERESILAAGERPSAGSVAGGPSSSRDATASASLLRSAKGEHAASSPAAAAAPTSLPAAATPSATDASLDSVLGQHPHHHHHHHHVHAQAHLRGSRRCPRHGLARPVHYRYSDDGDESDDEANPDGNDDDDDDEVDDEECDEGSYSPSSGSGSYCSSLASDTAESTYEGDEEGERGYDEDDEDEEEDDDDGDDDDRGEDDEEDFARANSDSSSECGSETSYTPSSSHSDSDVDAEGAELSSSNFSSNPSLVGPADAGDEHEIAQGEPSALASGPSPHRPCQVCKRRESAQLEANKLRVSQAHQASAGPATSGPTNRAGDLPHVEEKHAATTRTEQAGEEQLSVRPARAHGERIASTRRKRAEGTSKRPPSLQPAESQQLARTALGLASSDFALPELARLEGPRAGPEDERALLASGRLAAHRMARSQLAAGKQARKPGLLRRRSSSASSLLRIASSRHQNAAGERLGLAAASKQRQGSAREQDHHRHHRAARGSERHRPAGGDQSGRSFHRKSRPSKSQQQQQQAGGSKRGESAATREAQQVRGAAARGEPRQWRRRPDECSDGVVPKLLAMNDLSPDDRRDLVWEFVSANLLGEMSSPPPPPPPMGACEASANRFFMRSYNSDETLLRSQEYHPSSSTAAALESQTSSRARRRFSGQDHLQYLQEQQNLLATAYNNEFGHILENLEAGAGEAPFGAGGALEAAQQQAGGDLLLRARGQLGAEGRVDSSVISLLGDQMLSFKHSTLSLDDQEQLSSGLSDPIVAQLKVTRDLVRALQRLTKYGSASGFNQDVSAYLLELLSNLGQLEGELNSDAQLSSCYIDHLTGRSIVSALDSLKRDVDDLPKVELAVQARLVELLGVKIAELKKRYNNLKYIREHYHRHHTRRRRQNSEGAKQVAAASSPAAEASSSSWAAGAATADQDRHSMGSEQDAQSIDLASSSSMSQSLRRRQGHPTEGDSARGESTSSRTPASGSCKFGSLCPVEFVFNIEKRLASRRQSGSRQVRLNDMTLAQLQSEKLELQKNLLRYEHWFGRPTSRSEFNLVGHLYERYRAVKIIKQHKQDQSD